MWNQHKHALVAFKWVSLQTDPSRAMPEQQARPSRQRIVSSGKVIAQEARGGAHRVAR